MIEINVGGEGMETLSFKFNKNQKFKKMMQRYGERHNVNFNEMYFIYEGIKLKQNQTPLQLEMKNGDEITAVL